MTLPTRIGRSPMGFPFRSPMGVLTAAPAAKDIAETEDAGVLTADMEVRFFKFVSGSFVLIETRNPDVLITGEGLGWFLDTYFSDGKFGLADIFIIMNTVERLTTPDVSDDFANRLTQYTFVFFAGALPAFGAPTGTNPYTLAITRTAQKIIPAGGETIDAVVLEWTAQSPGPFGQLILESEEFASPVNLDEGDFIKVEIDLDVVLTV